MTELRTLRPFVLVSHLSVLVDVRHGVHLGFLHDKW